VRYKTLGRSGLKISQLVLGGATFGELCDEDAVRSMVEAALDRGVTTFDTANSYGQGLSETFLGRALRGRRDQVVICTKVGSRVGDTEREHAQGRYSGYDHTARWALGISPNDQGSSRIQIRSGVEASLRRLGTDWIDVYQVHRWDNDTPLEETLGTLSDLVHEGKIRYAGCSGYTGWQIIRSMWVSERNGHASFTSTQVPYSVVTTDPERELLPACTHAGLGVLAFQCLAGGILTGRYAQDRRPEPGSRLAERATYRARYWNDAVFRTVERLQSVAAATGRSLPELALGWVIAQDAVTAALIGAERPDEVVTNLEIAERPLSPEELALVEAARSSASQP